jgi:hypothetical protein
MATDSLSQTDVSDQNWAEQEPKSPHLPTVATTVRNVANDSKKMKKVLSFSFFFLPY